ncbi:MAG TPA: hypothetical protein VNX46_12540 [Candidatus Acidoferrum sp.]|jgi:hypothetical protein|nr:hypothetical protein [Candidatus Acidoferrum sp.]
MNTTASTPPTNQRFEPNVQFAWGQMIILAVFGSLGIAILDCFRFPQDRSLAHFGCVCGAVFVGMLVLFYFRSARSGCQTVIVDDKSLTVETKTKRDILPWDELEEVTIVGDTVLKLKRRNAFGSFNLENHGFTQNQWNSIKAALKARGYEFKTGFSAI